MKGCEQLEIGFTIWDFGRLGRIVVTDILTGNVLQKLN